MGGELVKKRNPVSNDDDAHGFQPRDKGIVTSIIYKVRLQSGFALS
jgi:hypothetical protein